MSDSSPDSKDSSGSAGQSSGTSETDQNPEISDAQLVEACQQGDNSAYDELVTRYRGKIYGMIYHLVQNQEEAWDLSQDAFVKAWKALPKYEGRSSFYTWLYRISHNVAYDWLRKKKISTDTPFDDGIARENIDPHSATAPSNSRSPLENMELSELRGTLENAINQLSADHKEVVLLREVEGLAYSDISEMLGCSKGTVMSRLFYARKKLQQILSFDLDDK